MKNSHLHLALIVLICLTLLGSCGGGGNGTVLMAPEKERTSQFSSRSVDPPAASEERISELTAELAAALHELGKEISATDQVAPTSGNEVIGVETQILDADGNGNVPPYGVQLQWVERLLGDYDQNSVVNIADLSSLARYFGYKVEYDSPELHNGIAGIPAGDPLDLGEASDGTNPTADSGAFNWRLARIDGDGNGEIGIADITTIAQHWQETISGYTVYHRGPDDAEFEAIVNAQWPESIMTVRRYDLLAGQGKNNAGNLPVVYSVPDFYLLDEPILGSTHVYKIEAYSAVAAAAGVQSDEILVTPFDTEQLNDGIIPELAAEIILPGGVVPAGIPEAITGTAPLEIRFDASNSYIADGKLVNYLWDFDGDGNFEASSGTDPVVTHVYSENARFNATVRLIRIEDDPLRGVSAVSRSKQTSTTPNTSSIEIIVHSAEGNIPPYAKCFADKSFGSIPLTVNFDASGSFDEDGTIEHYEWDFDGDGVIDYSSSSPMATYTFGRAELSRVRVKAVDDDGGFDSALLPIITSNPEGDWPPSASLVVSPTVGSAPLDVQLDASGSLDPDGQIVSYEWDLDGDFAFDIDTGNSDTFAYTFTNSGVYNILLRVTDAAGQFDLARMVVNVNTAPFTGLEAIPDAGSGPLLVNFDASASQDLDGTIVNYEWDFDSDGVYDSDTGILPRISHTFYKVGVQTVTLKVTDNLGFSSTQTIDIEVVAPRNNLTPTISLSADVVDGTPPLSVVLTATAADPDADGGVDHYDWDFEGDGVFDDSTDILNAQLAHEYVTAGRYNATVRVVDIQGGSATAAIEILVHQPGDTPPVADFTINPVGSPPGTPVTFDASMSTDDQAIVEYAWDFQGDGTFDVVGDQFGAEVLLHNYANLGTYNTILRITDSSGAVDYTWKQVFVGNVPILTVVADRDYTEVPNGSFNLDASRSAGVEGAITNFEWDMDGDGTFEISTGVSPFVAAEFKLSDLALYPGGIVSPRLKATNEIGASATTNIIMMPARDPATGEPLRDPQGNLVLGTDGLVLLEEVTLQLRDDYDEVEDNDQYDVGNFLVGPAADGAFSANPAGDTITALKPSIVLGSEVPLTRNEPSLGDYVAGSLGELNLGTIYDGDDEDWYAFRLSEGAHVNVKLTFADKSKTDLNLRLYDSNGKTPLAHSLSTDQDESIDYDFRDPGIYYIRANRFVGEGQDYQLAMTTTPILYFPEGTVTTRWDGGTKDVAVNHDPGGDPALSAEVADDFQTTILDPRIDKAWGSIDKASDPEDWYYFNYSSSITTRVECSFSHAQADIDIFLYDQNLNLLGYSNTADDDELIWRPLANPGGTKRVYVRVVAYSGGQTNYTLAIGYPAGQPRNLTASDGSSSGTIAVSWDPPASGGNTPNGYSLFVSDQEDGIYQLLADELTATSWVHDLTAQSDLPWQNTAFWYKVQATITGQQDSEFSNSDSGYVNGVAAPVELTVSDFDYLDRVIIQFYDSPSDPDLGTGKFGLPPLRYEVYANPSGLPETLIATFFPGDGQATIVPPLGGIPSREGELFGFEWNGLPNWTSNQLQGKSTTFTVKALNFNNYLLSSDQSAQDTDSGGIAGVSAPTGFSATNGLFSDRTRVSWDNYSSIEPDGYILQFQGEYDSGWTNVTAQAIPHSPGDTQYDHYVTGSGGTAPASGKYRIRAYKEGMGYSPWASSGDYGYATDNGLKTPSYGADWWTTTKSGGWDIHVKLGSPSFGSIVPTKWRYNYWRGKWYGWTSWNSFYRESASREHSAKYSLSYGANTKRTIRIEVYWDDPTSSTTLSATYDISKNGKP